MADGGSRQIRTVGRDKPITVASGTLRLQLTDAEGHQTSLLHLPAVRTTGPDLLLLSPTAICDKYGGELRLTRDTGTLRLNDMTIPLRPPGKRDTTLIANSAMQAATQDPIAGPTTVPTPAELPEHMREFRYDPSWTPPVLSTAHAMLTTFAWAFYRPDEPLPAVSYVIDPVVGEPRYGSAPYPVAANLMRQMDDAVEEWVQQGILAPLPNYRTGAPIFPIPKPDGSIRLVTDYTEYNRVCRPYPGRPPDVPTLVRRLAGASYFTVLDIAQAYTAIPMSYEASIKARIISHRGHCYRPRRLLFGATYAPAAFEEHHQGAGRLP